MVVWDLYDHSEGDGIFRSTAAATTTTPSSRIDSKSYSVFDNHHHLTQFGTAAATKKLLTLQGPFFYPSPEHHQQLLAKDSGHG